MPSLNNQAYWVQRTGDIFSKIDKTDLVIGSAMFAYYQKAGSEINDKLNAFYQKYGDENGISAQQARQRVNSTDLSNYVKEANEYRESSDKDPELLARLNDQYTSTTMTALELLKAQMDFAVLKASKGYKDTFEKYLGDTADFVGKRMAEGFAQSTMNTQAIKAALSAKWFGGNYSSRIWNNGDQFAKTIQNTMLRGFTYGKNPRVTAKQLRQYVREGNNDVHKMKYVTERLVRSESTFIANAAIKSRYEKDGIEKYEFLATIDARTSNICRHMNHNEYLIKDYQPGLNAPPMHGNCRSTIAPADGELNKYDKYLKPKASEPAPAKKVVPTTAEKPAKSVEKPKPKKPEFKDSNPKYSKYTTGNITDAEKDAIKSYYQGDAYDLNSMLREGEKVSDNEQAKQLAHAISSNKAKQDMTLHRKVMSGSVQKAKNSYVAENPELAFPDLKVGDTFSDKAFMSTSKSTNADRFDPSSDMFEGDVELHIKVPKGANALDIQPIADEALMDDYESEEEVLLQHGAKFKVVDIKEKDLGFPLMIGSDSNYSPIMINKIKQIYLELQK